MDDYEVDLVIVGAGKLALCGLVYLGRRRLINIF